MAIRYSDPFRDPTDLPNREVNCFVTKMIDGVKSGELPILYGHSLKGLAGCWRQEQGDRPGLVVEIGCHKGDVLRDLALDHEETLFVGLDITFKRVVETARKAEKAGLKNLRSVLANARGLGELFAASELDGVVIFYPDPWTRKKRQLKNRLLNKDFIAQLHRLLKPGGFLWFKTDHGGYFEDVSGYMEMSGFSESVDMGSVHPMTSKTYMSRFEGEFERRLVQKFEAVWTKNQT